MARIFPAFLVIFLLAGEKSGLMYFDFVNCRGKMKFSIFNLHRFNRLNKYRLSLRHHLEFGWRNIIKVK